MDFTKKTLVFDKHDIVNIQTNSLRACAVSSEIFPPLINIAVLSFSNTLGSLDSRARFTRWFFGFLKQQIIVYLQLIRKPNAS